MSDCKKKGSIRLFTLVMAVMLACLMAGSALAAGVLTGETDITPPVLKDEDTKINVNGFGAADALKILYYSDTWQLDTTQSGDMTHDAGNAFTLPGDDVTGSYFQVLADEDGDGLDDSNDAFQLVLGVPDEDGIGIKAAEGSVPDLLDIAVSTNGMITAAGENIWVLTTSKMVLNGGETATTFPNNISTPVVAQGPVNPFLLEQIVVLTQVGDTHISAYNLDEDVAGNDSDNQTPNTNIVLADGGALANATFTDATCTLLDIVAGGDTTFAVALKPDKQNMIKTVDSANFALQVGTFPPTAPASWTTDFSVRPALSDLNGGAVFTNGDFVDPFTFILKVDTTTADVTVNGKHYSVQFLPTGKVRIDDAGVDADASTDPVEVTYSIFCDSDAILNVMDGGNSTKLLTVTDGIGPYVAEDEFIIGNQPYVRTANEDGDTHIDALYIGFSEALHTAVASSLAGSDLIVFVDADGDNQVDDEEIIDGAVTSVQLVALDLTDDDEDNEVANVGVKINLDDTLISTEATPYLRVAIAAPLTDIKDANGARYGLYAGTIEGSAYQLYNHFTYDDAADPNAAEYADADAKAQLTVTERRLSILKAPVATDFAAPGIESAVLSGNTLTVTFSEVLEDVDLVALGEKPEHLFVIRNASDTKISYTGTFAADNIVGADVIFDIDAASEAVVADFTIQAYTYPANEKRLKDNSAQKNVVSESNKVAITGVAAVYSTPQVNDVDHSANGSVSLIQNATTLFYDMAKCNFASEASPALPVTTLALVKDTNDDGEYDTQVTNPTELNTSLIEMFLIYDGDLNTWNRAATAASISGNMVELTLDKPSSISTHVIIRYQTYTDDSGDTDVTYALANAEDMFNTEQKVAANFPSPSAGNWMATTVDTDYDGIVDAIDLEFDGVLTEATAGSVTTDSFDVSLQDDGSSVPIADTATITLNEAEDKTTIRLVLDPSGTLTDWYPSDDDKSTLFSDASNFLYIFYSGDDLTREDGSLIAAFVLNSQNDGCDPVPVEENDDQEMTKRTGQFIQVVMSEDLTDDANLDGDEAAKMFVFLDSNGNIINAENWLLETDGGAYDADNLIGVDCLSENNAQSVAEIYLSQAHAGDQAKDTIPNALTVPQYNNQLLTGTKVAVSSKILPQIEWARAFICDGYYKYVWVKLSETVSQANASEVDSEKSLCMAFEVVLNFKDDDGMDAYQTLTPKSVKLLTSGEELVGDELLIAVPHAASEGTNDDALVSHDPGASDTGVRPVQLIYKDNSELSGYDYLKDEDDNAMATETQDITWYAMEEGDLTDEIREADVHSVEVWGTLTNFDFLSDVNGAAEVVAYEAYCYLDVSEDSYYNLELSFEYGPLAKKTKGAFALAVDGQTEQCHQNGSYITLVYDDDIMDDLTGKANYDILDPIVDSKGTEDQYDRNDDGMITLEDFAKAGYCYLHTDILPGGQTEADNDEYADGSSQGASGGDIYYVNHGFNFGISFDPSPQGEHDSVFYVKLTPKEKKDGLSGTIAVSGSYGIKGSGAWTKNQKLTRTWKFWENVDSDVAGLETYGGSPGVVGIGTVDFSDTTGEYRVVALDKIAPILRDVEDPTIEEQKILSRICDRKVVLVLQQKYCQTCSEEEPPTGNWDTDYPTKKDDNYVLLNGVTDDVDITYNFYNKDGDFRFDPDRKKIFDYAMTDTWSLLPVVPDKVYYSSSSAPSTSAKYPNGTARATAKVKVDRVSDAIIGLNSMTGLPFVAADDTWILGLDSSGVTYAKASDISSLKGGYAYALNVGASDQVLYTFGYIMPDNAKMTGGAMLTANVIDVDKPSSARSSKNLGWNLMADVADIDLTETTQVDYVITFNDGRFDSWIKDASTGLSDFTVITNDYAQALDADDSDENVATGYRRGKGYFVHTMK